MIAELEVEMVPHTCLLLYRAMLIYLKYTKQHLLWNSVYDKYSSLIKYCPVGT